MKLHLGSGNNYLEDYTNVELPQNRHQKADVYSDINALVYDQESVDEILISHVFEHFHRFEALSLLVKWNNWLKIDGMLIITVPDFEANTKAIFSNDLDFRQKQILIRHVFGSHEADWAVHRDGWYLDKFHHVLSKFGFVVENVENHIVGDNPGRYDIKICARKVSHLSKSEAILKAKKVLSLSAFDDELNLMSYWESKLSGLLASLEDDSKDKNLVLFFSKDRAAQLDCALETFCRHCKDYKSLNIKVLYKCSDSAYEVQYLRLKDFYPEVEFVKETSFRNNVLYLLSGYDFCLLGVDDSIYVKDFYFKDAVDVLSANERVIGFSLRLGENISYCYMLNEIQSIPEYSENENILTFDWRKGEFDFGYPLEISSSIYRADDIMNVILRVPFNSPNTMELVLNQLKDVLEGKTDLSCYRLSVCFANPINIVQTDFNNRNGNVPALLLAQRFHVGMRIITDHFNGFIPVSPHQERDFLFRNRNLLIDRPEISIIVPTYNGLESLKECVASIFRNTNETYELIIIDNAKEDGVREFTDNIGSIKLIQNKTNVGPAAARNQGLALATGKYIAFIDDDVIVTRNWSTKFISYLKSVPSVGMIGARSNWASGPQLVTGVKYKNLLELEKFAQDFSKYDRGLIGTIRLVSFCLFVRMSVVDKIGALDETFGLYGFEDDDYSMRSLIAGFNPVVAKDIYVHHTGGPMRSGDQIYVQAMSNAWEVYKAKWGIPKEIGMGDNFNYYETVHQEFDSNKHYLPLVELREVA